ncbi:hypothetical protein [Acidisarcina polymorpha]|nr:hypothetical protein [Acidisarcina polymorpha]
MEKSSSLKATRQPETAVPQQASSRSLRLFNGSIHWISAVALLYAFISNGESNHAMNSSVAMKGEVKVGVVVGLTFFVRFIWASSPLSAGGRWTIAFASISSSTLRLLMNLGIYLGVAATVISGLLIAYLRPGARVIPHTRGLTDRSSLNAAINSHVFVTSALEWLCAFHVAYFVWLGIRKKTHWGQVAGDWLDRNVSGFDFPFVWRLFGGRTGR